MVSVVNHEIGLESLVLYHINYIPTDTFFFTVLCFLQNAILPWSSFLLPAGVLEDGEVKEQVDRAGQPQMVFAGERIFLATSSNPEFGPLWQPLLDTIGARVRVKPYSG